MDDERHYLSYQQRETVGLPEAWFLASGRLYLKSEAGQQAAHTGGMIKIFSEVKRGFELVAGMEGRREGFRLNCPDTAVEVEEILSAQNVDPVVVQGFHAVRGEYPNPTQHAPKDVIDGIHASL